jgi:hypothetical protein
MNIVIIKTMIKMATMKNMWWKISISIKLKETKELDKEGK